MEALEKLVKRYTNTQVMHARVEGITRDSCEVLTLDGKQRFFKVSISAVVLNDESKFLLYPSMGSVVIIAVDQDNQSATLLNVSQVDKVFYQKGSTIHEIDSNGYRIERENENLKEVLNDLIDEVNKIKVIYGNTINIAEMLKIKARLNKILK